MLLRLAFLLAIATLPSNIFAAEVRLTVTEPTGVLRAGWPVTSGIPVAQGELYRHQHTALFDADGNEVPLQTEILSRWPDGSIRWLLLDFQVDLQADESQQFVLRYGREVRRSPVEQPLLFHEGATRAHEFAPNCNTGPLWLEAWLDHLKLLDGIWLDHDQDGEFSDSERVTDGRETGIVLRTPDGTPHRIDLSLATSTTEQHGPLRACVRFKGKHRASDGSEMFPYVIRLHLFRGQPFFKFDYTFINDYQDELMARIDSIELVCSTPGGENANQFVINGQRTTEPTRLMQVDDQQFQVNGETSPGRAPGWAAVATANGGIAVGVNDFWQNWPKSVEVAPGQLRLGLCPTFPDDLYAGRPIKEEVKHYYYLRDGNYTFKIGVARTHQLWAMAFTGEPRADQLADFFRATQQPLLAQCSPEYVCQTGALGQATPADPQKHHGYDAWLDAMFQKHLDDQETVREYGMLNFGDWYDEMKFGGGWGNQEYDTSHIFFTQYLRSGDRRYFDRARQGAWHLMDVDTLHEVNPHIRGLDHHGNPHPGGMWTHSVGHTGGYYLGANLDAAIHYQRGMLQNLGHVWIGGLSDCYLLTGNRRALEVAQLVADRVASEAVDTYSDHLRTVGWPLNLLVTAYELTGDDKYLAAADRQWETLQKHFDPDQGWVVMLAYGHCSQKKRSERCQGQCSYMLALTLSSLARYHQITGDPEVLDAISVGLDQMIRESWHEEAGSFYPTACIHYRSNPPHPYSTTTMLAALAFAHEIKLTGNQEHRRIFQKSFRNCILAGHDDFRSGHPQAQAAYAGRGFHFAPYGLRAVED